MVHIEKIIRGLGIRGEIRVCCKVTGEKSGDEGSATLRKHPLAL